jgi:hypothetical protein
MRERAVRGSGCLRTALTLASSRRAVPRWCRTTRDICAHLWTRCTGAATGGTSSILPCLFVAEALDREWFRGRGTRLHCRRSVSVPRVLPSRMQRSGLPPGENQPVRQLHRDGVSTVRRPSKVASKGGRPRRKAAQENKAAKDTEDPLVKLERAVGLLDRGLLSVREYELLKQHILTDLLSTELGWSAAAQDKGRGVGRTLEDAGSFTARGWGRSSPEVGTGRVRVVCGLTPASVLHVKSQTLEPTAAVEPTQHGAKAASKMNKHPQVQGGSPRVASSSEMSPRITAAVRAALGGAAHRGGERVADGKTTTMVGAVATASPLARGRARGGMVASSTAHTLLSPRITAAGSVWWGRTSRWRARSGWENDHSGGHGRDGQPSC